MRAGYVASSVALRLLCSFGVRLCSNLLLWRKFYSVFGTVFLLCLSCCLLLV